MLFKSSYYPARRCVWLVAKVICVNNLISNNCIVPRKLIWLQFSRVKHKPSFCNEIVWNVFSRKPLVSFGELQELKLDDKLGGVEDIEVDQLGNGGFLVGNQHSVARISPSLKVDILAGKNCFKYSTFGHEEILSISLVTEFEIL